MYEYTVINVGQGDCTIINVVGECKYKNYSIIVDLGDGNKDIFNNLKLKDNIILCLTHSHKDHIGGLNTVFNHINKIKEVWIPAYFNELIVITKFILSLKGVNTLRVNTSIQNCQNDISSYNSLQNIFNKNVKIVYDGLKICDHILIHNPTLLLSNLFKIEENEFKTKLMNFDFEEISNWSDNFDDFKSTLLMYMDRYNDNLKINEKMFILEMLNYLRDDIINFIENPSINKFNKIYTKLNLTTNDCSIINEFKHKILKSSSLFTGDASIKVFNRLIKENKLNEVQILKIPHHGSNKNISKKILDKLNPEYCIVSHNNGLFGKQKDPHPNLSVIHLLNNLRYTTLYTNNVIKKFSTIYSPTSSKLWQTNPHIYFEK